MPWIDPALTIDAAVALRRVSDEADVLRSDLLRALTMSDLVSATPTVCAEVDEELGLLATLLTERSNLAAGFTIALPQRARSHEQRLFASLLDGEGATARIAGPLAVQILHDHHELLRQASPPDAEGFVSKDDLRRLSTDPRIPAELLAAIRGLLADDVLWNDLGAAGAAGAGATFASSWVRSMPGAIRIEALELHLRRVDLLERLTPIALDAFVDPSTRRFSADELIELGISMSELTDLGLPTDHGLVIAAAIRFGAFTHSPTRARDFIARLPVHAWTGAGLDIRDIDAAAIRRLHQAAIADLGEGPEALATHLEIIAHLPETTDGYRNQQITWAYAELAMVVDQRVNGEASLDFAAPSSSGANWFFHGATASDTVGSVIRGEVSSYGASPHGSHQDMANGNQAIFADFVGPAAAWLRGQPIEPARRPRHDGTSMTESDGFDIGPDNMVIAFERIDEAATETDVGRKQELMLESTIRMGLHEQSIVDPYISLGGLSPLEHAGAVVLSTLGGLVPGRDGGRRSVTQIMADDGTLEFRDVDGREVGDSIAIGEEIPPTMHPNNLVRDTPIRALVPELPFEVSEEAADDWASYDQRLSAIAEVFRQHHTDPALIAVAVTHAKRGGTSPTSPSGWTADRPSPPHPPFSPEQPRRP